MEQPEDSTGPLDAFFAELLKAEGGRFEEALKEGLAQRVAGAGGEAVDLLPVLAPLLSIETEALGLACREMRADGLHPTVPAGLKLTLEMALPISRYLRGRLGISPDPET